MNPFPTTNEELMLWTMTYADNPDCWFDDIARYQDRTPFVTVRNQLVCEWIVQIARDFPNVVKLDNDYDNEGLSYVTVANVRFVYSIVYREQARRRVSDA